MAVAFSALVMLKRRRNLREYWLRRCLGAEWKRQFPDASSEEIRRFLALFADAFLFRSRQRLKFSPSDRVMDIYHAVCPGPLMADSMELETLVGSLREEYGVDLLASWKEDVTLGDIFRLARDAGARGCATIPRSLTHGGPRSPGSREGGSPHPSGRSTS